MFLTPYQRQSGILATNCEVADRHAILLADTHGRDYAQAKKEYQLSHQRYSPRVSRAAAPPDSSTTVTAETMVEDLAFYTSCAEPSGNTYYAEDGGGATTRGIDVELRERARTRQSRDRDRVRQRAQSAILSGSSNDDTGEKDDLMLSERLEQLAAEERQDLQQIEAAQFLNLARLYHSMVYGRNEAVLSTEHEARRALQDMELSMELETLSRLRDRIHLSEELLMIRAMGLCAAELPHNNNRVLRITAAEEAGEMSPPLLDSMYAVPLWQRVHAIRAETEAEEAAVFRIQQLAHVTEMDFVEKRYGRQNMAKGGIFEMCHPGPLPEYLDDSVRYIYSAERLFCELGEETGRMAVVDEALQAFEDLRSAGEPNP